MLEAINLANQAIEVKNGGPFGAVVVRDNEIVGRGRNQVTINNDPTAHAEVNAIRDACANLNTFKLDACVIYTSCEPCPMCFGAITWARIEKIYYAAESSDAANAGFDDAFIYRELSLPKDKRAIPSEQHDRDHANKTFDSWINFKEKIEY